MNPQGVAIDPVTGKTWITTAGNNCRVFAVGRAGLEAPGRIAVDATHVYVGGQTSVRRIERAHGGISTFVGDPRYNCNGWGYRGPYAAVGRMADEEHQTHIGKYGGARRFPDDWVQFPTR